MSQAHVQGRDEMKTCPYDKSHRVTALKFTNHIIKCRRNNEGKLSMCPFNATHLVPPADMPSHMANCPDRLSVERELVFHQSIGDYRNGGNVQPPSYDNDVPAPTENWDLEANENYSRSQSYDPTSAMSQVKFRNPNTLSGLKPAQKKAFRKDCWEALSRPDSRVSSVDETVSGVTAQLKALRLPKDQPIMHSAMPAVPFVGRGRRIAANIYNDSESVRVDLKKDEITTYVNFARGRGMKFRKSDEQNLPGTSGLGRTSAASSVSVDWSNYEDDQVDHVRNKLDAIHLPKGYETQMEHVGDRLKEISLNKDKE